MGKGAVGYYHGCFLPAAMHSCPNSRAMGHLDEETLLEGTAVGWGGGALLLRRSELFRRLQGFGQAFVNNCEAVDLATRAIAMGRHTWKHFCAGWLVLAKEASVAGYAVSSPVWALRILLIRQKSNDDWTDVTGFARALGCALYG